MLSAATLYSSLPYHTAVVCFASSNSNEKRFMGGYCCCGWFFAASAEFRAFRVRQFDAEAWPSWECVGTAGMLVNRN